jgi:formyltetrahydrofolate-dependent phosphoribosylglycinamide formyltransferase
MTLITPPPLRLVVLISGNGSNLQAIIDAIVRGDLHAKIAKVVANQESAYGLERAHRAGIPTSCLTLAAYRKTGRTRAAYDADLAGLVADCRPDLIVLAGWMHVLSPMFLDRFPGRVINLHPALPGQFSGVDAIARAWAACRRGEIAVTGVMVHQVVPEVDAGPVLAVAEVPIDPAGSLAGLEARIHAVEHRLLVQTIGQIADARQEEKIQ